MDEKDQIKREIEARVPGTSINALLERFLKLRANSDVIRSVNEKNRTYRIEYTSENKPQVIPDEQSSEPNYKAILEQLRRESDKTSEVVIVTENDELILIGIAHENGAKVEYIFSPDLVECSRYIASLNGSFKLDDEFLMKKSFSSLWAKLKKQSGILFPSGVHTSYQDIANYFIDQNPFVNKINAEWESAEGYDTLTKKFIENKKRLLQAFTSSTPQQVVLVAQELLEGYKSQEKWLDALKKLFSENTALDTTSALKLIDSISALSTWSGRQADTLGFTDVIDVSHTHSENLEKPNDTVYTTFEMSKETKTDPSPQKIGSLI